MKYSKPAIYMYKYGVFLPLFQCWNFLNVNYLLVRVVTYISRVEAFVTRIKIESSNQSPF